MSTRGLYRISDGSFVRTQGEIPKGERIDKVEVPVDSKGLCDYLNALRDECMNVTTSQDFPELPQPEAATPPPPPPVQAPPVAPASDHAEMRRKLAQELRGMTAEAIEERILEMKGPTFGRTMAACIERLGSLGKDGWQSLRGHFDMFPMPTNYDRGLHLLALAQIERMDEPKPKPKTYEELRV